MDHRCETESAQERAETRLTGLRISPGLGMGTAWVAGDVFESGVDRRRIGVHEIEGELARLRAAFDQTRAELEESARRIEEQFTSALAGIFRAHALILDSLLESGEFERELRDSLFNSEATMSRVFRRYYEKFRSLKSVTLQQRADDIADLGRKVLRHLRGEDGAPFRKLPPGSVLVVERLLPSDVVTLSRRNVAAVVVQSLGQGSHAALLAREKSIPTVAEFPSILDQICHGDELLIDGYMGTVVIAPQATTKAEFQQRLERYSASRVRCKGACAAPARTVSGESIRVEGNVGVYEDVELAIENGADGVGLFRIEQLYLARELPPTADELLDELRTILAPLRGKPVTIRLLDIGGDKPVPFLRFPVEANPLLGKRGVRLLLDYVQLARTQLAAILRLSQEQEIRVLVPMVTLEQDIQAMRGLFDAVRNELAIDKRPRFGAMIETPAAALSVPSIARHVDFLCVGTNDLTQYTLAVGRDDPAVNRYYLDDHSSILRLLGIVVAEAGHTPITLCGEAAGREQMIPQLLTIGFRSLSIAPTLIPSTKELIRSLRIGRAASTDAPSAERVKQNTAAH